MKTPVERAAEVYQREPCARSFRDDLEIHLLHGFVFSRPDFFVMGRPVIRSAPRELIVNPLHRFPSSECDTWHVYLMAGNLAPAYSIMPWPLPWLSFERKNVLRFWPMSKMQGLSGSLPINP